MTTSIARFQVNGIEVGSLPRTTYDAIVQSVRRDRRLYFAYAINFIGGVVRGLSFVLRAFPWVVFILFACMALFDPDSFAGLVADFRAAEPSEIAQGVRTVLLTGILVTFMALIVAAPFMPNIFGIKNPFSDAVSRRVRGLLEVPTDGELTVTFYEDEPEQGD